MEINNLMPHTSASNMVAKTKDSDKAPETNETKDIKATSPEHYDRYEKGSDSSAADVPGIYQMGEDEEGNPKILFDKPEEADENAQSPMAPEKEADTSQCTVNTDKVDSEIEKLKKQIAEVQQQLQQVEGDTDKRASLERKLQSLNSELQSKDNDAYRKQHATYTYN